MRNTVHKASATLDDVVAASGKHQSRVEPIWSAVRADCDILLLKQNRLSFDLPPLGKGAVIVIEDDTLDGSSGPDGFDTASFRHLASSVDTVAILAHGAITEAYAVAAAEAMRWGWALVIQTRPEHEHAWLLEAVLSAQGMTFALDPRKQFWRTVR